MWPGQERGRARHLSEWPGPPPAQRTKRARVPVKSNPAAFRAAIKWASIASGAVCANAPAAHRIEKMAARFFIAALSKAFSIL